MDISEQYELLAKELNIPKDRFHLVIYTSANNFIKKYENRLDRDPNTLVKDLKQVVKQIQVYGDYGLDILSKYQMFSKLQQIIKGVIHSHSSLINYIIMDMTACQEENARLHNQISDMTRRVYDKCVSCDKNLSKGRIDNIQQEISMKFKDLFTYFAHDLEEINKLEEQARLILHKKNLGLQGISEQVYIEKLVNIRNNIDSTIHYVTSSLDNIIVFQHKLSQIQEFQQVSTARNQFQHPSKRFQGKQYVIKLSMYFAQRIKRLNEKLDGIRRYFVPAYEAETQTTVTGDDFSTDKLNQVRQQLLNAQILNKQYEINISSLDKKLIESRSMCSSLEQKVKLYEQEIDKYALKLKNLEIQLQIYRRKEENPKADDKELARGIIENYMQNKRQTLIVDQKQNQSLHSEIEERSDEDESQNSNINILQPSKEESLRSSHVSRQNSYIPKKKSTENSLNPNKNWLNKKKSFLSPESKEANSVSPNKQLEQSEQKSKQNEMPIQNLQPYRKERINKIKKPKPKNSINSSINDSQSSHLDSKIRNSDHINQTIKPIKQKKIEREVNLTIKSSEVSKPQQIILNKASDRNASQDPEQEIKRLYNEYSRRLEKRQNKDKLQYQQFKDKIFDYIDEIGLSNPTNKSSIMNTFKKNLKNKLDKADQETQKNHKDQKQMTSEHNKQLQESKPLPSYPSIKRTLPDTMRNEKARKKNSLNAFEKINLRRSSGQIEGMSNSEDNFLIKHTKIGGQVSSKQALRGRHSEILDNYNFYLKNKQKMSRTNDFGTRFKELHDNDCTDLSEFTKDDYKIIYISPDKLREVSQAALTNQNQPHHKKFQSFEPAEIRFMKEFFTRLANIHLNRQQSYEEIRLFLVNPLRKRTFSSLPGVNSLNEDRHGDDEDELKESINSIIKIHRCCGLKGKICKHLSYFMKKLVQIEKNDYKIHI